MTVVTNASDDFGFPVVTIPATVDTPEAAIRFLVGQLVVTGQLSDAATEAVVGRVLRRESLGTTGIGKGIAVPHAGSEALREIAVVVGRVTGPLAWPTLDSVLVRLVCVVVAPRPMTAEIARQMEALVRRLRGESDGLG
jgi:mannitol/fructose-specific phosphotransferase system IIA component (Ntr-type)